MTLIANFIWLDYHIHYLWSARIALKPNGCNRLHLRLSTFHSRFMILIGSEFRCFHQLWKWDWTDHLQLQRSMNIDECGGIPPVTSAEWRPYRHQFTYLKATLIINSQSFHSSPNRLYESINLALHYPMIKRQLTLLIRNIQSGSRIWFLAGMAKPRLININPSIIYWVLDSNADSVAHFHGFFHCDVKSDSLRVSSHFIYRNVYR